MSKSGIHHRFIVDVHTPSSLLSWPALLEPSSPLVCPPHWSAPLTGPPLPSFSSSQASFSPAAPFAFRSYELPVEAEQRAAKMGACGGSSKYLVWQVGGREGSDSSR